MAGEDREPYAAMMTDPRVGDWLGGGFSGDDALAIRSAEFEAQLPSASPTMERRVDGVFLGTAGVMPFRDEPVPLAPGSRGRLAI